MSFDGVTALVTGGARGQGAAVAVALAERGADVAVWDVPEGIDVDVDYPLATRADLRATADRVAGQGRRCVLRHVDVRDPDAVAGAFDRTVDELGPIDIVVCAAGIRSIAPASELTDAMWADVIDTNLHGTYHTLRSALPHLIANGRGRIVVVAAEEGRRGAPLLSHYAAAAWALVGLTKSVAWECAGDGIAANVICSGPVDTVMSGSASFRRLAVAGRSGAGWSIEPRTRQAMVEALAQRHPTGVPFVSTDAVVDAVLYCLGQPTALTGSVIDVSLGLSATNAG